MTKNRLSHVALILDGNKRWAKKNNIQNFNGYQKGFENIKNIIDYSFSHKIQYLTLFTLSSENFNRPSIKIIYELIYKNFNKLFEELIKKKNIKINIFGNRENLPRKIINIFEKAEAYKNDDIILTINLAFNYGFKDEVKNVLKKFNDKVNEINLEKISDIDNLFTLGSFPDPEILIRTGGHKRLSNFIMYNLTYTELFFTNTLWPDFSKDEYDQIINDFYKIDRKYGL